MVIEILLVISILLFLLYLTGWLSRRRIFRQIEQLEKWKNHIENRPVADELGRIKRLKMAGETEIHFEKWKRDWDEIITQALPDVEEMLLDVEDYANRFRFIAANKLLEEVQEQLGAIESALDTIISEVDYLVDSEEQNRKKMTVVHEQLQDLKRLLQKHSIDLGISYAVWHDLYQQASEWYNQFQDAQQNGNYLQAQELLNRIEEACERLYEAIDECPTLIKVIEHEIPQSLKEVAAAIEEMEQKGYAVSQTGVEEQLERLKKLKAEAVTYMQNGQIKEMKEWKAHIEQEIEAIYQLLEQEVINKQFVERHVTELDEIHHQLSERFKALKKTVADFKAAYSWDQELEEAYQGLDQQFKAAQRLVDSISAISEPSKHYSQVKPDLDRYLQLHDQLLSGIEQMDNQIQACRRDELAAKEECHNLKRQLSKVRSKLRKSNLPGLPGHVQSGLAMAEEAVAELNSSLESVPLDMHRVQHQLEQAEKQVQSIAQVAETVMEMAAKAEIYIQYANRYRNRDEEIRAILEDAERAFRNWEYQEALELAEEALNRADKNWRNAVVIDENNPY